MYRCEGWTIKESWVLKNWCFWTVVLKTLESPWTARRSNQAILKEISPAYSLEGLMLKPKLPYSGYLMRRTDSLEKTLMLGKIEGRKRREQHWTSWLDYIINSIDMSLSKLRELVMTGKPVMLQSMGSQKVRHDWVTKLTEVVWWVSMVPLTWPQVVCWRALSSVQFSHSVVSDSLRPHELQHARPPCPSPTPRVHSKKSTSFFNLEWRMLTSSIDRVLIL